MIKPHKQTIFSYNISMLENLFNQNYELVINPKLKYIHLSITEQGELLVKSPTNAPLQIAKLIHQKRDWIEKSKKRFSQKKGKFPLYQDYNPHFYYLGEAYTIDIVPHINEVSTAIEFTNCLNFFYKMESQKILLPLIQAQAKKMNVIPQKIAFRKTKRQWGSCSSKNNLSFHAHISKLPLDVIQYIIVHELAHIRHKHHQKAFWDEVKCYSPNYKKLESILKEYIT